MAQSVVVQGTLDCTTVGNSVSLTSSGFGTPTAAIVFVSNANTSSNPQAHATQSIGFWTAASQSAVGIVSVNGVITSNTGRQEKGAVVGLMLRDVEGSGNIVSLVEISATTSGVTDGLKLVVDSTSSSATRYVTAILFNSADTYYGSINLGTGTSAIDVTAPGFKPDLLFAYTVGAGNDTINTHAILTFGAAHNNSANTVTQGMVNMWDEDAQADTDCGVYSRDDSIVGQYFNSTLTWRASVSAFDASGFSITPSASSGSDIIHYLAIKLADPDDAYVGFVNTPTSTGNVAYTDTGFTPESLLLANVRTTAHNTDTTHASIAIGVAGSTTNEHSLAGYSVDAAADSSTASRYDTEVLRVFGGNGTVLVAGALNSFDSDGWTISYPTTVDTSARKVLAIAVGNSAGGASPQTISVTHTSETDTAQAISAALGAVTVSVSATAETESAQAITPSTSLTLAINPALETEAAQGITVSTSFLAAIGAASEADFAQAIAPVTAGATALLPATESDSAQAITPVLGAVTIAVGTATESDAAQPISYSAGATVVSIGTATETVTVQAITPVPGGVIVTVNAAAETDVAQSITLYVPGSLSQQDLDNIAAAVWAHADAISAHSKLDEIIARITC